MQNYTYGCSNGPSSFHNRAACSPENSLGQNRMSSQKGNRFTFNCFIERAFPVCFLVPAVSVSQEVKRWTALPGCCVMLLFMLLALINSERLFSDVAIMTRLFISSSLRFLSDPLSSDLFCGADCLRRRRLWKSGMDGWMKKWKAVRWRDGFGNACPLCFCLWLSGSVKWQLDKEDTCSPHLSAPPPKDSFICWGRSLSPLKSQLFLYLSQSHFSLRSPFDKSRECK